MHCFRKAKNKNQNNATNETDSTKAENQNKKKDSRNNGNRNCGNDNSSSSFKNNLDEKDGHGQSKKMVINDPKSASQKKCWKGTREKSTESTKYASESESTLVSYQAYEKVAYMPVSKNNPFYNMNHPRRGKAVIFNFDHWDNTTIPDLGLSPRLGSKKDKNDLTACLKNLDFDVKTYDNCGNLEMWAILEELRNEDHSDADCLLIAIFTHGERNTVYVRDGTQIPVNLIWENFEAHACPSLAGKPKIFIVQACRGKKYDGGTTLALTAQQSDRERQSIDVTDSSTFSYVIPNAADIIVAFSCPLGHYSWRNSEKGSWFIQAICKVFNENAYHNMDLQTLFTTVAREVALNYESKTDEYESNKKKQVTSTSSTLIRTVLFAPKADGVQNVHPNVSHTNFDVRIVKEADQANSNPKEELRSEHLTFTQTVEQIKEEIAIGGMNHDYSSNL